MRSATCHPERRHMAFGLCANCYERKRSRRTTGPVHRSPDRRKSADFYAWKIKKRYGLTVDAYEELLARQGGRCAICGGKQIHERNMSVDHDHETNEVRGLLCDYCNRGLGLFRDDPERLIAAARYLLKEPDLVGFFF